MKKNIFTLAALLIASAAFIACSSSNDDITEQKPVSQTGKYIMTVKASKGDDAATRALSLSGHTLNATWADGEEVSVFEGSTPLGTLRPDPTTISNNDTECTLSGTLDTAPSASGVTLTLKFNSASYSGQDGTLATIASTCDYAEATTTVTVEGNTISGTNANFVNKQAIAKFTLKDKVYGDELNASKLIVTVDVSDNIKQVLALLKLGGKLTDEDIAELYALLPSYELNPDATIYSTNGAGVLYLAVPDVDDKIAAINDKIEAETSQANLLSKDNLKFILTATVDGDTYTLTKEGFLFENGKYYEITAKLTMQPEGALRGKFTVNDTGKKVHFSKSNLQATTSNNGTNWSWHFADTQYARVGLGANVYISGNGTVDNDGNNKNIDLFGWSTSTTHLGISNSTDNSAYSGNFVDWGLAKEVYDCIGTGWRTLTGNEWIYLMDTRDGNRYAKASINGTRDGFIILPDGWTNISPHTLKNYNSATAAFTDNTIPATDWTNKYEKYGAVFLPVTGQRSGTTINGYNTELHYWSSTSGANTSGTSANANHLRYITSGLATNTGAGRCNGFAVRLVRDIQ